MSDDNVDPEVVLAEHDAIDANGGRGGELRPTPGETVEALRTEIQRRKDAEAMNGRLREALCAVTGFASVCLDPGLTPGNIEPGAQAVYEARALLQESEGEG